VPWGYLLVGAATFLENSRGAVVVVPGETLVVLGGFYARLARPERVELLPDAVLEPFVLQVRAQPAED
jgi:membrane protein DedA with SNARE-associated domain